MVDQPKLIIQVPRGGALERQLTAESLPSVTRGEVVIEFGQTDPKGNLEASTAAMVVLSVLSPEALPREAGEVRRLIAHAGTGSEPLLVVVEVAEELREEELAGVLEAAGQTSRAVILRIIRST